MADWSKEVFANNLRRYMERNDVNQKELAEIVGVSAPTMHDWLKAKKFPRIDKVEKLANHFGILKSDLIEEKTEEQKEVQKKADSITQVVLKMKTDIDFLSLVERLCELDADQVKSVSRLLDSFLK